MDSLWFYGLGSVNLVLRLVYLAHTYFWKYAIYIYKFYCYSFVFTLLWVFNKILY